MKRLFILIGFCLVVLVPFFVTAQEEFHGEMEGWANVIRRYGAKADGVADDTKAIQMAIDSLSVKSTGFNTDSRAYAVVYLPKGNYRISATLRVKGKIGFMIVGEDPELTRITWAGNSNDTMVWVNGSAYFSISRIGFRNMKADNLTAIGINWKTKWKEKYSESYASLNIEVNDCVFTGGFWRGIHGGTDPSEGTNANDSEVSVRRCSFFDITEAAISINGYNALDYWIWDCRFIRCFRGVQNKNGNYHVYNSYFEKIVNSVFVNTNAYYVSVRGCYINGTDRVMYDFGKSSNPFKRVFEGNIVLDTKGPSIEHYHLGKISFTGNSFGKIDDEKNPYSLIYDSWATGSYEVLSLANRYKVEKPWRIDVPRKVVYSYRDSFGTKTPAMDSKVFISGMSKTPKLVKRPVFEVGGTATLDQIQQLVNKANQLKGQRPVLHFQYGTYRLTKPLVIPPGSDMQMEGDGMIYASVLEAVNNFPEGSPLIQVQGPSKVSICGVHLDAGQMNRKIDGIRFDNVDQKNAEAFTDMIYSQSEHSISLLGTKYLYVQNQNSFFCDGNIVLGPGKAETMQGSGLFSFGGGFAGMKVDDNGRFFAKDCWWEGANRMPLNLSGTGQVSIDCAMVAPEKADSAVTIQVDEFKGMITLANMYVQGAIRVKDKNPGLKILLWNIHLFHKMRFYDFISGSESYQAAFLGLTAQCFDEKRKDCSEIMEVPNRIVGISKSGLNEFVYEMVKGGLGAVPRYQTDKPAGVSAIRISRVSLINFRSGILFTP